AAVVAATAANTDHYVGLASSFSAGVIYCSAGTAALVRRRLRVAQDRVRALRLLTPTPIRVTLLDANHCPGAVMVLFEMPDGKLHLHVGDFRWDRTAMLAASPPLRFLTPLAAGDVPAAAVVAAAAATGPGTAATMAAAAGMAAAGVARRLDSLYLDTTYCDPRYAFPPQRDAIQAARPRPRPGTLVLFGCYSLGKERLYLEVAARLGLRVYVEKRRHETMALLGLPPAVMSLATTDPAATPLWAVPIGHVNFRGMKTYTRQPRGALQGNWQRVIGVQPTGWTFRGGGNGLTRRESGGMVLYGVPYSEHSSFVELRDCVRYFGARRVVPTVGCGTTTKVHDQLRLLGASL
ncbi:unnamed protein product, partial [Phaeothamnion confervicola]